MISVVIPTYNRAELTKRAALSVLSQTYKDLELIIVDDGSTDNTADVVASLNDSRVHYIYQENSGACVARNNGIEHAVGEFIAFHDSDDVWHVDKLEKQMAVLQEKNADVVFCRMNKMRDGKKVGTISDYFKEGFLGRNILPMAIGTQTLIGKSEVFKANRFDPDMPRFQEFETLVRIQKNHSIYCMDESLVDYILQDDSISMNPKKFLQAWNLLLSKHPDFLTVYADSRDRIACDVMKNAFFTKDKKMRHEIISMAFKFKKSPRMVYRLLKYKFL
ncbi:MAG: glycosyltransferase [Fibrobacter sp.]|nr:glycosyltransferase [Fibrobacter sp.]